MILLLLMYVAPFLAMALFHHARRRSLPDDAGLAVVADVVRRAVGERSAVIRPVAAAVAAATLIVAVAEGFRGGVAFVAGASLAVVAAALVHSATASAAAREARADETGRTLEAWSRSAAVATAIAALTSGCVAALAWFFADPAGSVVIAAFVMGFSAGGLFLGLGLERGDAVEPAAAAGAAQGLAREAALSTGTAGLHTHLAAVAAALMIASTAEPGSLLSLGGLLAETETLRSELLLLPLVVLFLAPLVAATAASVGSALVSRRGSSAHFDAERWAAVASLALMLVIVVLCSLSWAVLGAYAIGLAATQVAVIADQASSAASADAHADRNAAPSLFPALISALALIWGGHLAGAYGAALAALGMTVTFATASASASARDFERAGGAVPMPPRGSDRNLAEAAASVAATLALLVAAAPVLVAESAHQGSALEFVALASPGLLVGVLLGAATASLLSWHSSSPEGDDETARAASRALAIAAGLPVLAGLLLGEGGAVGVALGFGAWASASAPVVGGQGSEAHRRLRRSVLLACARTMALAALVGAPLMV